jgi:hypothetical protein
MAKTQLGLDDDRYQDVLECVCGAGVRSSKNLNFDQYNKLIQRFTKMGFELKPKVNKGHRQPYHKAPGPDPDGLPSPAHLKKINDLYDQLGWVESERRIGFNRRVIKKPWPQNREEANKIIEALKSMVARKQKMG